MYNVKIELMDNGFSKSLEGFQCEEYYIEDGTITFYHIAGDNDRSRNESLQWEGEKDGVEKHIWIMNDQGKTIDRY